MATKKTAVNPKELEEAVRDAVSEWSSGSNVGFFEVIYILEMKKGIHCEKDELLAVLASLCPMVLAVEVSTDDNNKSKSRLLVRFTKV